jgi:hypothetical protein
MGVDEQFTEVPQPCDVPTRNRFERPGGQGVCVSERHTVDLELRVRVSDHEAAVVDDQAPCTVGGGVDPRRERARVDQSERDPAHGLPQPCGGRRRRAPSEVAQELGRVVGSLQARCRAVGTGERSPPEADLHQRLLTEGHPLGEPFDRAPNPLRHPTSDLARDVSELAEDEAEHHGERLEDAHRLALRLRQRLGLAVRHRRVLEPPDLPGELLGELLRVRGVVPVHRRGGPGLGPAPLEHLRGHLIAELPGTQHPSERSGHHGLRSLRRRREALTVEGCGVARRPPEAGVGRDGERRVPGVPTLGPQHRPARVPIGHAILR